MKDWDIQINYGIKTGFNEAFIIDKKTREELIAKSPKNDEIIRPIILGKNIKRYKYSWEGYWLINIHNGVKIKNIPRVDIQDNYPAIFKYLKEFLPEIKERSDQGDHWTNLRNCAYLEEFDKPKIVWGNLALRNQFAYIKEPMIINNPSNFLVTDNLYLLGVLNSKLADFYIKQLGVTRSGGYFEYKPMFVEQMPIALVSKEHEQEIAKIVEQILLSQKNTIELEEIIDNMVFDIYGLTSEERVFIQSFDASKKSISSSSSENSL